MAALGDMYNNEEQALQQEIARVKGVFPGIAFEGRVVAGSFADALLEEVVLSEAELVVTGAEGDYNDFLSWDNHILDLFIDLPIPVVIVPPAVALSGVRNLAFACNYRVEDPEASLGILRKLWEVWQCRFHLVYVNKEARVATAADLVCQQSWADALQRYEVYFHELRSNEVAAAVDQFCQDQSIDLLAIKPHRHGLWTNLFGKNNTRDFAHLHSVPVLALRSSRIP